jgi:hypothetical protein
MTSVPPPQGINEIDYEAIEAAVTETVRGRWFLAEFARRNRVAETRQLLDAMARLEAAVTTGLVALPATDPSIRLMIQRIKEIAAQLDAVAGHMRDAGVSERFVDAVDLQGRAVAGLMRGATLTGNRPGGREAPIPEVPPPRMPRADLPASLSGTPTEPRTPPVVPVDDPRRAALSGLDGMTLAEKLALFS